MIEKIIFNMIAIAIFTITFLKLIKKNDTSYIYLLVTEFIGIAINFIELLMAIPFHLSLKIIMYLLSVLLPALLFWLEKWKKIDLSELFRVTVAIIYEKMGDLDKGKSILINFLDENQNSYRAHKRLAQIYEKEENYEAAISEYRKVIELNRKDRDSTYQLAVVLNKNKENQEAINVLQEILKQTPESERATNLLGDIFFEQQQYKEAVSLYMTALRYHPGSYELYYNLGMAHTMLNDFQKAKEFYEKAAEINSMAFNAKLNLGQIALMHGDLDEAEKYFRESSKQEDIEAGCYYYLSKIALLKGDEDKAKNYMNVAVQLDKKVYSQMQKDPIFIPIRNEIPEPLGNTEDIQMEKKKILTQKERTVNSHLLKTCILVENLSNEDLKVMKKKKEIAKEQKQKE